jgi:hypothetical protein
MQSQHDSKFVYDSRVPNLCLNMNLLFVCRKLLAQMSKSRASLVGPGPLALEFWGNHAFQIMLMLMHRIFQSFKKYEIPEICGSFVFGLTSPQRWAWENA